MVQRLWSSGKVGVSHLAQIDLGVVDHLHTVSWTWKAFNGLAGYQGCV